MSTELTLLITTAASLGLVHTITGPDHYLPFVVIARARRWTTTKTIAVVSVCGIGHVLSSVVLGFLGVFVGIQLNKLVQFEAFRGNIAAWLMIAFGFGYAIWGLLRSRNAHRHSLMHQHNHHTHDDSEEKVSYKKLTPWLLFLIFVFGPCEPLIPMLMYPAAELNTISILLVATVFSTVTIVTMLIIVLALQQGVKLFNYDKMARYSHALAGLAILLCGVGIQFLGL